MNLRPLAACILAVAGAAAEHLVLVSGYDPDVRAFAVGDDGAVRAMAISRVGRNPSFLAIAADGGMAYACEETTPGQVTACTIDRATGALTPVARVPSGGAGPCHAGLHPSGRWLFTAHYGDGRVGCLPLAADGLPGPPVSGAQPGANAHMALADAAGTRVLVPCKGADLLAVLGFDAASGALTPFATASTGPGAGPRHMALAADGRRGWLVDELSSSVQLVRFAADGVPVLERPVSTLPGGYGGRNTAGGIILADGGRLLLTSNRGHDSIALFAVDADGQPRPLGHTPVGRTPRHLAASADGTLVLAACQGAGRVDILRRDGDRLLPLSSLAAPAAAFVGFVPAAR